MSDPVKIVFVGVTGYIGGTIYDQLLKHPQANRFQVVAYTRSDQKAKQLQAAGVKAISGPLSVLEQAVADASVVFNAANSDDTVLLQAILDGAKKRYAATQVRPVVIHTSGTAVVADQAMGQFATEKVYDDMDETLKDIPITVWHRNVDIPLGQAHEEGYVRTFVIAPPIVWGLAKSKLVDAGIQNPVTPTLLLLSRFSYLRGKVGFAGPQLNVQTVVEVNDVADLHVKLFDAAVIQDKNVAGGYSYYFAGNGDVKTKDIITNAAKALHKYNVLDTDEINQLTEDDYKKYPALGAFGINFRVTDTRARSLGWKPTKTGQDYLDSIDENIQVLSTQPRDFPGATWAPQAA